jgi:hypothetical protein
MSFRVGFCKVDRYTSNAVLSFYLEMEKVTQRAITTFCLLLGLFMASAHAAVLKSETAAAFDHYVRVTIDMQASDLRRDRFFIIDRLPDASRQEMYAKLRRGEIYIEQLQTRDDGRPIHIPGGMVHHWAGVMFIPGATLAQVAAVLQDYDHHKDIYAPDVRQSKLLERDVDEARIYYQLYHKATVTVVINATFDVHFANDGPTRGLSRSYSTRMAEVENPDTPQQRELPVGNDHGYLWRLDTYWRIEEKDGGAYVQLESIALSRNIPLIFAWLVNPLTKSLPRSVISNLLTATRKAVSSRELHACVGAGVGRLSWAETK